MPTALRGHGGNKRGSGGCGYCLAPTCPRKAVGMAHGMCWEYSGLLSMGKSRGHGTRRVVCYPDNLQSLLCLRSIRTRKAEVEMEAVPSPDPATHRKTC